MTPTSGGLDDDVTRGVFTPQDKEWLSGEKSSGASDQKRRCKSRVALAIKDLAELANEDFAQVSNLGNVGELFEDVSASGMDPEECASNLVALAYHITNGNIDYEEILESFELHRAEGASPNDPDREKKLGLITQDEAVDDLLAFRRALCTGIHKGKARYDHDVPRQVIVRANTPLYNEPTEERLKSAIDTDDWRDVMSRLSDAGDPTESRTDIDRPDAPKFVCNAIELEVIHQISERQNNAPTEILNRYFNL